MIKNYQAQFMLLAGFIVAIGLVITTVMLNNIIFQSNVAGEEGLDPLQYDILNLMQITKDEIRSAYRNASASGTIQNQTANFTREMQSISNNLSKIYAMYGEVVKLSWDISNWSNHSYANFSSNGTPNGNPNWSVVKNVRNITVFEFSSVGVDGYFLINVTNSSGRIWSMNITESSITIINKTGGIFSTNSSSYINVLDPTYEFNDSTSNEIYSIDFVNGDKAWGRFAVEGYYSYNKRFVRQRHYILNATMMLSTSRVRVNITIPVSVPW